jgi:hypothetical protein
MAPSVEESTPSRFALPIPLEIGLGRLNIAVLGTTTSGQNVTSVPIAVDVERDIFRSCFFDFHTLGWESQGETFSIQLFATYSDRAVHNATHSSRVTTLRPTTRSPPVDGEVNVTAVASGKASIKATYTLGSRSFPASLPVTVEKPRLTRSPTSLTFSRQGIGTKSSPQQVTVTNITLQAIKVLQVAVEADDFFRDRHLRSFITPRPGMHDRRDILSYHACSKHA